MTTEATESLPHIDLDTLTSKPVGTITVFGKKHTVFPANGRAVDLMVTLRDRVMSDGGSAGPYALEVGRNVVKECVPSLSSEEVGRLNFDQLAKITGMATGQVDKVTAAIAAAEKNDETGSGSEDSKPETTKNSSGRRSTRR